MYIKINTLIAVYVYVSWKTSFSCEEFFDYQNFMQLEFYRKGNPLKILLSDSMPELYNKEIKYVYNQKDHIIHCPKGVGVEETTQYLKSTMDDKTIEEFSALTHKFFNEKYHNNKNEIIK